MKTFKLSLIAATATAAMLAGPVTAAENSTVLDTNTDINGEPIKKNRTTGVANDENALSASNGLDTNTDINGDAIIDARTDGQGTIVAGAQLDTNTDINGDPIRANRADMTDGMVEFVSSTEIQQQYIVDAMDEANLNELQASIAANGYLNQKLLDEGYEADDVVATYMADDRLVIVVR